MAVFREYNSKDNHDRSMEDRRRHRQLVEKSIKENLSDIISEESIIGESGDKKIKIPIRGIKEYQFIYGDSNSGIGSGNGQEKKGDKLGKAENEAIKKGKGGPGNQEGEDIYETEITIDDLMGYFLDDLELPYMDKKRFSEILSKSSVKRCGYQKNGINPRLAKKRTVIEKIKRKKMTEKTLREADEDENNEADNIKERFPFRKDDVRYYRVKQKPKKEMNAAVICVMDTSGSMDMNKKFLARSFFFILYRFVKSKYENVEVKFIAHSTTAKVVSENEFFHKVESGGTYISSGLDKAIEVIYENYNPSIWNVYTFYVSDGDNWDEDNEKAIKSGIKLSEICNLFSYAEIDSGYYGGRIKYMFEKSIDKPNFVAVKIDKKEDLWKSLKQILKKEER